jgi:putative Holliday junction resolvase
MRVLGIDFGAARMGLAVGDTESRIASPWDVWQGETLKEPGVFEALRSLCQTEHLERLIVGVPRPLADRERVTPQMETIRAFIERLRAAGFDVAEEDETWSSVTAARQVRERGERGKRDDLAAAAMLQGYLDRSRERGG